MKRRPVRSQTSGRKGGEANQKQEEGASPRRPLSVSVLVVVAGLALLAVAVYFVLPLDFTGSKWNVAHSRESSEGEMVDSGVS